MPEDEVLRVMQAIEPQERRKSVIPVSPALSGLESINPNQYSHLKLNSKRKLKTSSTEESFIKPYVKTEQQSIKDEYLALWYDKLALEEYV